MVYTQIMFMKKANASEMNYYFTYLFSNILDAPISAYSLE